MARQVEAREARSLSDLNYLAANPPQYPHHPELRQSLTLYISRVPGTRDIILSTLRPQRKNVTGEDVANSLYYVHLNSPADELLAAPRRRPEDVTSPRSSGESARPAIPRKPLPPSARVPNRESSVPDVAAKPGAPAEQPATVNQPGPAQPSSENTPFPAPQSFEPVASDPDERPPDLPPRPATNPSSASGVPFTQRPLGPRPLMTTDREIRAPDTTGLERPSTPPAPRSAPPLSHVTSPQMTSSPTKMGQRPSVLPFSLTLIRRDPTTGGQWNVGRISSFQTNIPTPETADPRLNPEDMGAVSRAQKIDIRIETSGYAKYRGMPSLATVDAFRPGSGQAFAQAMKGLSSGQGGPSAAPAPKAAPAEEGFTRQVAMTYSKTLASNIKEIKDKNPFHRRSRASSSAAAEGASGFSPEDIAPPRRFFHRRTDSASTVGSSNSAARDESRDRKASADAFSPTEGRGSPPLLTTEPGPGLKPKGYTFYSPWEGICEFRTSTNGRSVKCRHILDPKSPKFNPVAVAHAIRDAPMGRSRGDELTSALAGAKSVSELRFNLAVFKSPKGDGQGEGAKGKWDSHHIHSQFSKLLHLEPQSSDDEDYDDEDEPMDLSLGKEDAGGGRSGTRAKLGKLIIHDEGLKMLDLVVAANVGVWWTTWERTF